MKERKFIVNTLAVLQLNRSIPHNQQLPRRTAQQVPARRPGITTGFSTGKKLPHNGDNRLQSTARGL